MYLAQVLVLRSQTLRSNRPTESASGQRRCLTTNSTPNAVANTHTNIYTYRMQLDMYIGINHTHLSCLHLCQSFHPNTVIAQVFTCTIFSFHNLYFLLPHPRLFKCVFFFLIPAFLLPYTHTCCFC